MKQISPPELAAWLADAGRARPRLLDVREPWEFEKARIEGAELMPMREVPARFEELDRAQDVVAICHHGGRRPQVGTFLQKARFKKIHNPAGGGDAWSRTLDPTVPPYYTL